MENTLLTSPVSDTPAEEVRSEQQSHPETDVLAEIRREIVTECRLAPKRYLNEIRMAASGE